MRPIAGLLLTAATVVSASSVWAQSDKPHRHPTLSERKASALFAAPFATPAAAPRDSITGLGLRADPEIVAALDGPFVLPTPGGAHLAASPLAEPVRPIGGG